MRTFWKKIRNQFGMSMAEVMIASALAGGLALVIAQIGKNSSEVSKRADTKSSRQMLEGRISAILSDTTACASTFSSTLTPANIVNPNLVGATSGTGISLASLGIINKPPSSSVFLTPTSKYAEITLTAMKLRYVDVGAASAELYITGTYKISGKTVSMKPIMLPINMNNLDSANGWVAGSNCASASGDTDSVWLPMNDGNGIYYNSGKVGIGTATPDASLDIDRNAGVNLFSYWYSTIAPYKGIELQQDNYLVWEATTGTPTSAWGLGSVSTGFQISVKSTAGRPAGVRTIMDFNNNGDITVYPRTGSSMISKNFYVAGPIIGSTYCQNMPSACNNSFSAGIIPKAWSMLGGGLAINATIDDTAGIGYTATFGGNAVGNGGSLILGDNDASAAVHMYSVPSVAASASQTVDLRSYEKFKFDANSNFVLGNANVATATGNPSFALGTDYYNWYVIGGRGFLAQITASAQAKYSASVGFGNNAYSRGSTAVGTGNIAGDSAAIDVQGGSGYYSSAIGARNSATATGASAVGFGNTANVTGASAFGSGNTASGTYSLALGSSAATAGSYSTAIGYNVAANATGSWAIGDSGGTALQNASIDTFKSRFNGGYTFYTDTAQTANRIFHIGSTGNVGIGSGNPSVYSSLNGAPKILEMRNTGTGMNDANALVQTIFHNVPGFIVGGMIGIAGGSTNGRIETAGIFMTLGPSHTAANPTGQIQFNYRSSGSIWWAEAMRVTETGALCVGCTSSAHKLGVTGTAGLSTGTLWTNTSDARLKDIHGTYTKGLNEIVKLKPVVFSYKKNNALGLSPDPKIVGFVAQEVLPIFPEAISKRKDGYLEFTGDAVLWAMVNSIKDLKKEIDKNLIMFKTMSGQLDEHARKIAQLEADNEELKQEIRSLRDTQNEMKKLLCVQNPKASFCKN